MRRHFKFVKKLLRNTPKPVILVSIISWYIFVTVLIDFNGLYAIRNRLQLMPRLKALDYLFDASLRTINSFQPELSRVFDLLYLPYQFLPDTLPRYELIVDTNDLKKLEAAATMAMNQGNGFLTDEYNLKIPAIFTYENVQYQVKIKLRGDIGSHWQEHKKSWKIEFEKPTHFQNHQVLNLIIPEQRAFINDGLSKHVSIKLGLPTHTFEYVFLTLNHQDFGIYYVVPQFSTEFLEQHELAQGNLYSDRFGDVLWSSQIQLALNAADLKKLSENPVKHPKDYSDISLLQQAVQEKNFPLLEYLINIDKFLSWQAHSILMGSSRQDFKHNLKMYNNPTTGMFEFIPNDVNFSSDQNTINEQCQSLDTSYNPFVDLLFEKPENILKRNQIIWNYLSNPVTVENDIEEVENLYRNSRAAFYKGLHNSSILKFEYKHLTTLFGLRRRYALLKQLLSTPTPSVNVSRNSSSISIYSRIPSLSGFRLERILITDTNTNQMIERDKDFLPVYAEDSKNSCKTFATFVFSETIPCTECNLAKVELEFRNLTTNEIVKPAMQYAN